MKIRLYEARDEEAVIDLWERCGLVAPQNNPEADIQRKLALSPELFFVAEREGEIVASAMAGYEGHRGWINYLAVAPHLQRSGLGLEMLAHAESVLMSLGCPKINLQVRRTNLQVIDFYTRAGYSHDDVVSMGKRLIKDGPYIQ